MEVETLNMNIIKQQLYEEFEEQQHLFSFLWCSVLSTWADTMVSAVNCLLMMDILNESINLCQLL